MRLGCIRSRSYIVAKRHVLNPNDWQSVFVRLEELILANSGSDAYEETFKLLLAKIWEEKKSPESRVFLSKPDVTGLRSKIQRILHMANKEWPGIVDDAATPSLTDDHLAVCVSLLSDLRFSEITYDFMDSMFEVLVSRGAKGSKGQYFTPRHVVDFCVRTLKPKLGELICDPACGSGAFLVHSMHHMMRLHSSQLGEAKHTSATIWGFDFDLRAVRVAKALMMLGGNGATNVYRLNSLLTPETNIDLFRSQNDSSPFLTIEDVMRGLSRNFKGFDVILTNPPFAGEIRESHILRAYTLGQSRQRIERDVLFLERCVQLLKPGGRLAIVLPHNKLGADGWAILRQWLLHQMRVVAVIGLGRNTFLPHTHQKADVLVGIKRSRPTARFDDERIFFAVSERDGKNSRGQYMVSKEGSLDSPAWKRSDHDLGSVVEDFHQFCVGEGIFGEEKSVAVCR
jgi:type I restriction enzyme M protein